MSDPTEDAGEPAEKRVRKTRVAKPAAAKDSLSIPPLDAAPAAPSPPPAPAAQPTPVAPAPQPPPAAASHATHETPAPSAASSEGGDAGGTSQHQGQNRPHHQHGQNNNTVPAGDHV